MTAALLAIKYTSRESWEKLISLLKNIHPPKGRAEIVHTENPTVIVDFAHTPDGLEKILGTMRELLPSDKKLIAVFGCGGNRDTGKRPLMGAIAEKHADFTIVTSDNPRNEDPETIIADIKQGITDLSKALFVTDRSEAIKRAIALFPKDVIVIAGKGHEEYQIIGTTKHHFSDQEEIAKAISSR